jgi:hypothetical protein
VSSWVDVTARSQLGVHVTIYALMPNLETEEDFDKKNCEKNGERKNNRRRYGLTRG